MARTPDRFAGPSVEEETQYEDRGPGGDNTGDPSVEGGFRRVTNAIRFFVGGAVRQVLQIKNPPVGFDDVDMAGITNGQALAYNATSKQLEPVTIGAGSLPIPDEKGQILYACDATEFVKALPLVAPKPGWLINDSGIHLIVG